MTKSLLMHKGSSPGNLSQNINRDEQFERLFSQYKRVLKSERQFRHLKYYVFPCALLFSTVLVYFSAGF